jgi:hypothetical protein
LFELANGLGFVLFFSRGQELHQLRHLDPLHARLLSQIGKELFAVVEEQFHDVVVKYWVFLLQLVETLTHLLGVLDIQTNVVLLLQQALASIGEGAVVPSEHFGGRMESTAVVGQFEVHVVIKLSEC